MPGPTCTVRGCARTLAREGVVFRCGAGHAFDVARQGHLNLLQPQDRKSAEPGDSKAAVAARGRALAAGAGDQLARVACDLADAWAPAGRIAVLDVGCGDGFFLRALAARREADACGIDLSAQAAQAAARACPDALIVVANADRGLPWPDASFQAALSITARRPAAELRRVLAPDGVLVVAVPAADDLVELREEVQGRGDLRDRTAVVLAELEGEFGELERRVARARLRLPGSTLRDLLASTYRGARASQRERVEALREREVTVSHDVLALRPRRGVAP